MDRTVRAGSSPAPGTNLKLTQMDELVKLVEEWAKSRDLHNADPRGQMLKVVEEVGETAGALAKLNSEALEDGIGDVFVTLIILCMQVDMSPEQCLQAAYDEIKNRTGKTIDGVFIKDE